MKAQRSTKITFHIPSGMLNEIRQQMMLEGYGLRGKSKWVAEAIRALVKLDDYITLVVISDDMSSLAKMDTIMVDTEIKEIVKDACLSIRKQHPLLEGVQSRLIRTSIMQRLLRTPKAKAYHFS